MISAVVLAAGLSTRMGRPKLLLPWGATTVIGQVILTLLQADLTQIVVVTGANRVDIDADMAKQQCSKVRTVFNPRYTEDNMIWSLQVGITELGEEVKAVMVALGDQPQIEADVIRSMLDAYRQNGHILIVPSYQMHRGHPWLIDRSLWPALLTSSQGVTMRDFLHAYSKHITYLPVSTPSVLGDLDTPEDYARERNPS